jgi:O-antigen ligase
MRSEAQRRLPITTAALVFGSLAMVAWEKSVPGASSHARVGWLVLAAAAIALTVEMRGPTAFWALRQQLFSGPALLLLAGAALTLAVVLVSSHTNGCQCSGGAQGLIELLIWTLLVSIVVAVAPESGMPLVGAIGLGCFIAAVVALAGTHDPLQADSLGERLAGPYGNANYFAATQAMGLPIAVAVAARCRRLIIRVGALVVALTLVVTLVLAYSRSGLLAAAAGTGATVVLLVPPGRRLFVGAGLIVGAVVAGVILYPTFAQDRTAADFGSAIVTEQDTDASGWVRAGIGLIATGPSQLVNDGPDVLRVIAPRPGEGASLPLGTVAVSGPVHLRFQARASTRRVELRFGLEDNLIAAGPATGRAALSRAWRSFELTWRPSAPARHARAYFWDRSAGSFEIRGLAIWTTNPRFATRLSTRLLGPVKYVNQALQRAEQSYIRSRETAARIAIQAFLAHPLLGVGWERFPSYASTRSGVGAIATHDEYLRFAAELGVPGLLAIALLCFAAGWAAVKTRAVRLAPVLVGVLAAAAVELAFGNVLESPAVVLPLATATATAVALSTRHRAVQER